MENEKNNFLEEMENMMDEVPDYTEDEADAEASAGEGRAENDNSLGRCPVCGRNIVNGKYGIYCTGKCGMSFRYYGNIFTEEQVKALLENRKILLRNQKAKNGRSYDMYLVPEGTEDFSYIKKDGTEFHGKQFVFSKEYPDSRNGAR